MEILSNLSVAVSIIVVTIVTVGWRLGNWLWFRPKKLERYLRQQGVCGKPYRFFYGDLKEMFGMIKQAKSAPFDFSDDVALRLNPFLLQVINNYGKNSFVWFGPTPRVNIMNPEQIKDVFVKIDECQKVKVNPLTKLLVPGVADYEGQKWAKHRKILNPAFHQEKLKLMFPLFCQSCNMMIENWNKLMSSKESCELDVWPHLQNLSCDVISRAAFGSNYEEGKVIFDLLKELAKLVLQTFQSVYILGWRFLPTKINKRINQIDRVIKDSLDNIIKKREKAMKTGEAKKDDLLGILMESNMREIGEKGNDKSMGLSIKEVMDECRLFYFAGQETTSVLLVWTMILLSKYPKWQTNAREEVLQVFGKETPYFEGLNHLKIVSMILYEVLRLYPPVIGLGRTVSEEIRLGNLVLPAGVQLSLPIFLIHKDPEIWGDDACDFNPERFSGGVSKATNNIQGAFFPFGSGPRICIGQNFAFVEAKLALALILQHFSFQLSPSYTHAPHSSITVHPEHGAPLILHKL